ncbi:Mpo1-like protein [Nevskia soli]|uniref:Mpo1-like protein n=1 Tax=Nevskia soli TaxID=418856 RepID=UPI0004A6E21E|nr:Mpo1-like protein [Nevskia soli]
MEKTAGFSTFSQFYPFYLSEHADRTCRRLHFVGTSLVILVAVSAIASGRLELLWLLPILGYGFAWVGHFYFEKNRPATFKYPFYSFMGDFVMYKDIWTGKIRF